jgi:riboflavin kinase/FMN adenylyltransferase
MLGRPVSVYGTVIKGDRFGRRIGFPTANIDPHHEILPPAGVYSVNVLPDIPGRSRPLNGLCYIGRRPTLGKGSERRIEVYIFDCARDLYGHNLSINFLRMMRRDRKFPSVAALKEQIAKDAEKAKSFFRGKLNIETGSGYRVNCSGKSKKKRGTGSRNKRSLIRSSSEVTR